MLVPGLIVMLKLTGVLVQPACVGVMVICATCWATTFAAVKLIVPVPEAPSPMAVLSLVQGNVAPGEPVIGMLSAWPEQATISAGRLTVGPAVMVTVNCSWSEQPAVVAPS